MDFSRLALSRFILGSRKIKTFRRLDKYTPTDFPIIGRRTLFYLYEKRRP
jgi:hypothetical protein